jgi:acyl-CoA carboxylase subunit beta
VTTRLGALELADRVLDPGSFVRWDEAPYNLGPVDSAYAAALAAARDKTGLDEAVITGEGRVQGRRVALVVGEFGFLAGSIGVAAAERVGLEYSVALCLCGSNTRSRTAT